MSYEIERVLIETALKAGAATASIPIQWPNQAPRKDPDGFVRLTIMGGQGSLQAIVGASSPVRFPGVIDLAIFTNKNTGGKGMTTWADALAGILANQSLASGSVRIVTFTPRLDVIGESGDWFQANLSIPFQRDDN